MGNRQSSSARYVELCGTVPPAAGPGNLDFYMGEDASALRPDLGPRKLEFNDKDYFMITEQNSQISHQNSQGEEAKNIIHKQEAVCRLCYQKFQTTDDMSKMKCKCESTYLVHVLCAPQWLQQRSNNKCGDCGEDIQRIEVTLSEYQKKDKKNSTPGRSCCCFF